MLELLSVPFAGLIFAIVGERLKGERVIERKYKFFLK
ncbi:hypothetical protein [Bacillus phage FI_KG-Lek]|nr:hypothetical protein [Bacillus phage FI_KG-Lek]